MTFNYKGTTYKLKQEVVSTVKKGAFALAAFSFTGVIMAGALTSNAIQEADIDYKEVYISFSDSEHTSAVDAITDLNFDSGVDYRDLLEFFEDKNGVEQAGSITAGTYYVPVYKGE